MSQYVSVILALAVLSCCSRTDGLNPNDQPAFGNRRTTTTSRSPPARVEKIRDVEAVDPGLLSPSNVTVTRSVPPSDTLGKQFNTPGPFGNSFGGSSFGGNSFPGGVGNNNLGPETAASQFTPGIGQTGPFVPNSQVGGFNQPGQIGGFPNNGIFPGGGILPGSSQLPPGSVAPDTVAFSAARASDFTRVGITQVRFDFTLTDVGYGWYPDRSEFVCYYPGLYFFTFSGLSAQTRQIKLTLVKNNQEVVSVWGDTNGYQMGTNTAILTLLQGDRIYLILQEGNLHESVNGGRGYTTFSGFRIR